MAVLLLKLQSRHPRTATRKSSLSRLTRVRAQTRTATMYGTTFAYIAREINLIKSCCIGYSNYHRATRRRKSRVSVCIAKLSADACLDLTNRVDHLAQHP